MTLAAKLNLKPGQKVQLVNAPKGVKLDLETAKAGGEALLVFVKSKAEVEKHAAALIEAAQADKLAWIAYPKAGQLGTDLNRDLLWKQLDGNGIRPVRNVAIDGTWSALRFRPGEMKE